MVQRLRTALSPETSHNASDATPAERQRSVTVTTTVTVTVTASAFKMAARLLKGTNCAQWGVSQAERVLAKISPTYK